MDLLNNLALGFGVAFTLQNLAYAFGGAVLGTLIGVLPGLGPVATIAMLLPSIYALDATPALIMLAGIYYGAQYGGSTTAILINVPGEIELGGDRHRRLPDGAQGPRRAGAGRGRPGLVLRRLRGHHRHRGLRAAADRTGLQVRPGRVLQPDGAGPDRRRGAGLGLADQGDRDDPARACCWARSTPT